MIVSFYNKAAGDTNSQKKISIEELLKKFKDGYWKDVIETYRKRKNPHFKGNNIPCFTGSGLFSKRSNSALIQHSGHIIVDIDKLESQEKVNEVKSYIGADDYTAFCATSCGGLGLFVGIKVNPKKHKDCFKFIEKYYKDNYDIRIDFLDDLARLRFVTYDPEIIINKDSLTLDPEPIDSQKNKVALDYKPRQASDSEYIEERVSAIINNAKRMIYDSIDGEKHKNLLNASQLLGGIVATNFISYDDAYDILETTILQKPIKSVRTAQKTISDGLAFGVKKPINITENEQRRKYKHEEVKPYQAKKPQVANVPDNEEGHNRTHLDEYKDTPIIDNFVYETLPPLLHTMCENFEGRKRDIMLISAITALSGIVNNVHGLYHNKEYNPNLFGFIIAPPGSGKGAIDLAFEMGYTTKHKLKQINEEAQRQWEIEMLDWKKANKGKEVVNSEAPEQPSKQRVYVPADISNAGLGQLLNENNSLLMIDTEADTVGNIFKTDYGNYSPILRKAFQHETHKAYRKTNKEDIEVENIKLSVLYAGTPDQISGIMKDANNGLFSRFMFYAFADAPKFEDPWATRVNYTQLFRELSQEVDRIRDLREFEVDFSLEQRETFKKIFEAYTKRYTQVSGENATAVVFRYGLMCFRLCMVFSRLMQDEETYSKRIECPEQCFLCSVTLIDTLIKHAFVVLGAVEETNTHKISEKKSSKAVVTNKLLDRIFKMVIDNNSHEFTKAQFLEVAKDLGISESTAKRNLNKFIDQSLVEKAGHGKYSVLE